MLSALLGLTAAATASAAGYQSMTPTGQWFGSTFARGMRGSKQIALTFDDGPNDPHTLKLLDVLASKERAWSAITPSRIRCSFSSLLRARAANCWIAVRP